MQNRDRFSVVELLMHGLSVGALVLMAAVLTIYVGRAATRIPEIVGRQQIEERRNDARSAGERAGLGEIDGERPAEGSDGTDRPADRGSMTPLPGPTTRP